MTDRYVLALLLLSFVVVGLCLIMYPRATLRWFIRDRQWIANEPSALVVARIIGFGFVILSLVAVMQS